MQRGDDAGVGQAEGEGHDRDGPVEQHVDLVAPVVVVLDRILGQDHAEPLGLRPDLVPVTPIFGRVDRHRVRREQVHTEPARGSLNGDDLLGQRGRCFGNPRPGNRAIPPSRQR